MAGKTAKESKATKTEVEKAEKASAKKSSSELKDLIVREAVAVTDGKPNIQVLMAYCKAYKKTLPVAVAAK